MLKSPNSRNFVVVDSSFGNFDVISSKLVYDSDSDSYISVDSVFSLEDWLNQRSDLSVRDFDLTNLVNSGVDPHLTEMRMQHSRGVDNVENVISNLE